MTNLRDTIKQAMTKIDPEEAGYGPDKGQPQRHCGPVRNWPGGMCKYFDWPLGGVGKDYDTSSRGECEKVWGRIAPKGWCKLYSRL